MKVSSEIMPKALFAKAHEMSSFMLFSRTFSLSETDVIQSSP